MYLNMQYNIFIYLFIYFKQHILEEANIIMHLSLLNLDIMWNFRYHSGKWRYLCILKWWYSPKNVEVDSVECMESTAPIVDILANLVCRVIQFILIILMD